MLQQQCSTAATDSDGNGAARPVSRFLPVAGLSQGPGPGRARDALTVRMTRASQLTALGWDSEVNLYSHRMFCSLHLAVHIYGSNHEQR